MWRDDTSTWSGRAVDDVLVALASQRAGLDDREAAIRLARHGENALPRPRRRHWSIALVRNFTSLFGVLLWIAAVLAAVAGMPELGIAIVVVVLVNGLFAFWQEHEAERAAEALAAMLPDSVIVRRAGREREVAARSIVPGDVLVLSAGALVTADARVLEANELRVDLSALTGESHPVTRIVDAVERNERTVAQLPNLVFAGTSVASGSGQAVVCATGARTELGRIAALTARQDMRPSPLERELVRVIRVVTVLAVLMGGLFFTFGVMVGGIGVAAAFLFAIGIIVANVPEGLLPTLTLALALGVRRMAKRRALVKRLSSVETLGATTVILTDKTGTLTENEMTVRELWCGHADVRVTGGGYAIEGALVSAVGSTPDDARELLRVADLCCDARLDRDDGQPTQWRPLGDPTEAAILVAAHKAGVAEDASLRWPRIAALPFDSVRKRMTTIHEIDGQLVACMKGAPNEVIPRCDRLLVGGAAVALEDAERSTVERAHESMASRGLRVLAVARRTVAPRRAPREGWLADDVEQRLELLGLIAMEDPPRPEVPQAVAACRATGVRVYMVTGDGGKTAAAIATEIGLCDGEPRVVDGRDLDAMSDVALDLLFDGPHVVFARVAPEHKLRLVEACQRRGEVVAVTGDGVNDAPALKRADIGIAMGATGTDVARQAADMVLADDDFSSIVAAIREGRAVYSNVRKFVTYIFASNVPEIVPFIAFALFGIPLPLTVMQILAVDLGTDLVPALALGAEAAEPDIMHRPPRSRRERLLDWRTLLRAYAWLGMLEAACCLAAFFAAYLLEGWRPGQPMASEGPLYATATTMSFAGIVVCQIANLFACRNERRSAFARASARNPLLLIGLAVELAILGALVYLPPLAALFGFAPLGPPHWAVLLAFGPTLLLLEEARKALVRA